MDSDIILMSSNLSIYEAIRLRYSPIMLISVNIVPKSVPFEIETILNAQREVAVRIVMTAFSK